MPAVAMLVLVVQLAGSARALEGRVVDATGAAISDAAVTALTGSGQTLRTQTAFDGGFRLPGLPAGSLTLTVTAPAFADAVMAVRPDQMDVTIVLTPRGITENITVSAHPSGVRIATPASATVLDQEALARAAALTLDEQLRTVPGFSLFRRSSSRVANPTTQGVTLRGLAASGASRTLVLADGVPLNDPFGGWIYWDRIPAASIERVEVARGGSSDLHGTDALGGAIRIDTARSHHLRLWAEGGSDDTYRLSGSGGDARPGWGLFGAAEVFTTDGFVTVAPESRGAIDIPASSEHSSVHAGARVALGESRLDIGGSYFDEDRDNGTPFQTNATIVRQGSASATGEAWTGAWMARAFGLSQDYDQTFSAVAADRITERPTGIQHVDTRSFGGSIEWFQNRPRTGLLFYADYRLIDADLFEGSSQTGPLVLTRARQQSAGIVLQTSFGLSPRWTLTAGARGELWRSGRRELDDTTTMVGLFPRASIAWRAADSLTLRAAVHNSYRTPTINELYRPFRAGNTLTLANPALEPEDAIGLEGSALVRRGPAAARMTGFWTRLADAVVNVTLDSSPSAIVRERQNAGTIRAAGLEFETDVRLASYLSLTASAAYIDSVFTEGAGLDGLRVPQVPRWQAAAGLTNAWRRTTASIEWRFVDQQFDDDRNQFSLDPSNIVNGRVGWRPRASVELFAAIENALDEEQDVGRTPLRTIGLPRSLRAGLRWALR